MKPDDSTERPSWWREPLLHFVVLGGLLFALDQALVSRDTDPRTIVVDSQVVDEAKKVFRASRNRDPNTEELQALTRRWVDNEILFREGQALGVDRGDDMIRERVIFKALMVLETEIRLPPVDDAKLLAWFEERREKYDEPARFDFQEAVLSDDKSEAAARLFVQALNAGAPPDAKAGLRVFKGRPHSNLVQSYGADFAQALEEAPLGEWQVLPSPEGVRIMRLDAKTPAKPAVFEAIRNVVLQDWTDVVMADLRTAAVRERGKKYKLKYEEGAL